MTLALAFAIIGAFYIFKQNMRLSKQWFGLALITIGLHYIIYLAYSYVVGSLAAVRLVDIWTIPMFSLGLTIIIKKSHIEVIT